MKYFFETIQQNQIKTCRIERIFCEAKLEKYLATCQASESMYDVSMGSRHISWSSLCFFSSYLLCYLSTIDGIVARADEIFLSIVYIFILFGHLSTIDGKVAGAVDGDQEVGS